MISADDSNRGHQTIQIDNYAQPWTSQIIRYLLLSRALLRQDNRSKLRATRNAVRAPSKCAVQAQLLWKQKFIVCHLARTAPHFCVPFRSVYFVCHSGPFVSSVVVPLVARVMSFGFLFPSFGVSAVWAVFGGGGGAVAVLFSHFKIFFPSFIVKYRVGVLASLHEVAGKCFFFFCANEKCLK